MKNSNTKTKLAARVMLLVLLLASALNFFACDSKVKVDVDKKFNLNDGEIKFLCMSGISTQREVWNAGYCRGVYITDGDEVYERPYITYSSSIVDDDLGDGRTFYEKYLKRYFSFSGSPKYSMQIYVTSYAFQGEVGELKYEFDTYYLKGERIRIYNNDELIAQMSVATTLDMPDEYYTDILDKSLFVISADKYSLAELGDTAPIDQPLNIAPSLASMEISYLTIRDLRNSNANIDLYDYKSNFNGGYSSIEWKTGYEAVSNENKLGFYVPSLNANIQIEAEFYEYREKMGKIEYVFTSGEENGDCVELYSHSVLVGKVFYSSDIEIAEDWLESFLNENLVVISLKK